MIKAVVEGKIVASNILIYKNQLNYVFNKKIELQRKEKKEKSHKNRPKQSRKKTNGTNKYTRNE